MRRFGGRWRFLPPLVILVTSTTAAAATWSSGGANSVLWRGGYETGNWSQWNEGHLQVVAGGSAQIQSSVVREGRSAAVFTTPAFSGGDRSRSQIYLNPSPSYGNDGQENWFAWSTMIGRGSRLEVGGWNNLTAFHHTNVENPCPAPDHFAVTNARGWWWLRLDSWGGPTDFKTCLNPYRRTWTFMRILPGRWYDIVFHVKWSPDPKVGFVEVWINGKRVLPLTHAATLYAGDAVYLKQGYDGGGAPGQTTVYNDGTTLAGSRSAAFGAFKSGG